MASKEMEANWRPQLHLVGALVAGLVEQYYILNTDLASDSNMQATILSHVLDIAVEHLKSRNRVLPANLHIQADNTCRETRNQQTLMWAASLISRGVFRSVSIGYMVVGHTHIDIDQRFQGKGSQKSEDALRLSWVRGRGCKCMCARERF